MQKVDTLIHARWVLPIIPQKTIYENYSLAITGNKISDIVPTQEAKHYLAKNTYDLTNHVLMPGLINMHTHSPMTLFRGMADDLELMTWLEKHIWPAEQKWVSPEFCYDGTQLAILEMIRSGTTCFNEHFFYAEEIGKAATDLGMRACLGGFVFDFPTQFAKNADEYLMKAKSLSEYIKDNALLTMSIAPHAPYSISDESFLKIKQFVDEYKVPIHIHLHETASEVEQSLQRYKKRPIERIYDLGILTANTLCVHMTQVNESDIKLLQKTHAHVVHCPQSNLKLASGFCPTKKLFDAHINLCIGTDGAASNNDLDMFNELQIAAQLAKGVSLNPLALNATETLEMATINAAKALNMQTKIGSLETGKLADLIAIDLNSINTQPIYHPTSHLAYAVNSRQVSDVWIAGKHLLKSGKFTQTDENAIVAKAKAWSKKINSF